MISSTPRQALAPTAKKKKTWGGKIRCVWKMGPEGADKNAPSPTEKVPDAGRPRVPVTLWQTKYADKIPKKGASRAPAQDWAFPWESLLRGVGKTTRRVSETTPGLLEKVWPQNEKGKKKTRQKKNKKTLAASRPKKRASEGASEQAQAP